MSKSLVRRAVPDFRFAGVVLLFLALAGLVWPAGFGTDPDSWDLAHSAYQLATQHDYRASRLPGYPVCEFLFAGLILLGPAATNALCLGFAVVGVRLFYGLVRRCNPSAAISVTALLCLLPMWLSTATCTMDYMLSCVFLLAALDRAERERWGWAGVFLSLATGARMSNGLFGLVFLWALAVRRCPRRARTFVLAASATTALWLAPLLLTYGTGFFRYSGYFHWAFYKAASDQYYLFGGVFIVGALVWLGARAWGARAEPRSGRGPLRLPGFTVSAGITLAIAGVVYLYYPGEPEYLLPVVVVGLLWIVPLVRPRDGWLLVVLLVVSVWIPWGQPTQVWDIRKRRHDFDQALTMLRAHRFGPDDVLIAHTMEPALSYVRRTDPPPGWDRGFRVVHIVVTSPERIRQWQAEGKSVHYAKALETELSYRWGDLQPMNLIGL